jgi:hypothetical protein
MGQTGQIHLPVEMYREFGWNGNNFALKRIECAYYYLKSNKVVFNPLHSSNTPK